MKGPAVSQLISISTFDVLPFGKGENTKFPNSDIINRDHATNSGAWVGKCVKIQYFDGTLIIFVRVRSGNRTNNKAVYLYGDRTNSHSEKLFMIVYVFMESNTVVLKLSKLGLGTSEMGS